MDITENKFPQQPVPQQPAPTQGGGEQVKPDPVIPVKPQQPDDKDDIDPIALIPNEPYQTSPLFYEIANYFGVEQRNYEEAKEHLSVITDWAIMQAKSNKIEDVLVELRKLEDNLVKPAWGEKRYANVYRYLRLASKKMAFEKALSAFTKNE